MSRITHIDGLRAVAVLAVLAFHVGLSAFAGGFVGVDVFYVISGYLITGMILRDLDRGKFGFVRFYSRRAVRLLPALFVTVALCFPLAALLYTPSDMQAFASSAIAAVFAYSNILFWSQAGYFDAEAITKPLLHTWSLSVEWQIYAVWPLLLWAVVKLNRKLALPVIVLATAISLALVWRYRAEPDTVFYWMPFRIFQFGIGAIILWLPSPGRLVEPLLAAGLALIAYSVFGPAIGVWPALGAALAIYAGSARFLGAVLSNPVSAYIGRISYSVYLVHWPMIVFWRYYVDRALTHPEMAIFGALSIALSAALYHAIEKPFHERRILDRLPHIGQIAALVFSVLALTGTAYSATAAGWIFRLSPERQAQVYASSKEGRRTLWGRSGCSRPCSYGDEKSDTTILLQGDSHLDQYAQTFKKLAPDYRYLQLHGGSCWFGRIYRRRLTGLDIDDCVEMNKKSPAWIASKSVDVIVRAQRWAGYSDALETMDGKHIKFDTIEELVAGELKDVEATYKNSPAKIVLVNMSPSTRTRCELRPKWIARACPQRDMTFPNLFAKRAREFVAAHGDEYTFVDPMDYLCTNGVCPQHDEQGRPLYIDDGGHLTLYGAEKVVPAIISAIKNALAAEKAEKAKTASVD